MFEFRLFRTPVRVQIWFFLIAVFIGEGLFPVGSTLGHLVLTVAMIFVGVLAHEFGHAFAGRMYGLVPEITLHGMGGVTSWASGRRLTPQQRIVVSVAGPAVGIALGTIAMVLFGGHLFVFSAPGLIETPPEVRLVVAVWVFVNLGWGVLNMLPIMPLDGGHVLASVAHLVRGNPYKGRIFAHWVSLFLLAAIGAWLAARITHIREAWNLLLVGLLAWSNVSGLTALTRDQR